MMTSTSRIPSLRMPFCRVMIAAIVCGAMFVAPAQSGAQTTILASQRSPAPGLYVRTTSGVVPVDISRSPSLRNRITLDLDAVPIREALRRVSAESGIRVMYADSVLPAAAVTRLKAEGITVAAALTHVLDGTNVDIVFTETGAASLVRRPPPPPPPPPPLDFTVRGRVTNDANGAGIPGVNVYHAASRAGTITDAEGTYSIRLTGDAGELRFSAIGYLPRVDSVHATGGIVTLDVRLRQTAVKLAETVVTGLASNIKRSNAANAVSTVSAKELTGTTVQETVDGALNGKLPGVNIRALGGAPGGGVNMQFRGISTLGAGSSQPLFIIDGVYADNSSIGTGRTAMLVGSGTGTNTRNDNVSNRIADLNPEDIESIEVLKGPSAAAIYGARANAGVVIVRTKRGSAGRTNFTVMQDVGFASILRKLGYDDWTPEKIDLLFTDPARNALEKQRLAEGNHVDWEDELYGERGLLTNTQLNMSGGGERTRFFLGAGFQQEDGIIKHTGFGRKSLRANIDHQLTSKIMLTSTSNYVKYDSDRGFTDNGSGASIGYNLANTPNYYDLRPVDGAYPTNPYYRENPFSVRDRAANNSQVNRYTQGLNLDAQLLQTSSGLLRLTMQGGLDFFNSESMVYFPEILQNQQNQANPGDVVHGRQQNRSTNWQAFLSYGGTLGATSYNTQLGTTGQSNVVRNLFVRGQGLAPRQTNMNQARVQQIFTHFNQQVNDVGVVGQQEVNWGDKVIGTLGVRFDKSTLNVAENKFYAFPKASLALNLSNFGFWRWPALDQFKLRSAYGETGGLPLFGQTFEVLSGTNIGGNLGSVISARGVDPDLKPERAAELELGVDLGLRDGLAELEVTYYRKKVSDLILDLVPASSTGINAIATNAADLTNNGLEVTLRASPVRAAALSWSSQFMYWHNRTKVTRLDVPSFSTGGFGSSLGDYLIKEGYSPTTIVGTPADPELTVYGDGQPDYNLSWHNSFTLWRNIELSALMHYQHGGKIINLSQFLMDGAGTTPDWSDDDDGDGVPNGRDRGPAVAGRYIDDGTYFKLREVGLYYTLPASVSRRLSAQRARLGLTGRNLLLVSDYRSYDPEVSVNGVQAIASTVEIAAYPSARRVLLQMIVDF